MVWVAATLSTTDPARVRARVTDTLVRTFGADAGVIVTVRLVDGVAHASFE